MDEPRQERPLPGPVIKRPKPRKEHEEPLKVPMGLPPEKKSNSPPSARNSNSDSLPPATRQDWTTADTILLVVLSATTLILVVRLFAGYSGTVDTIIIGVLIIVMSLYAMRWA